MKQIKIGSTIACVRDEDYDEINSHNWQLSNGYPQSNGLKMHNKWDVVVIKQSKTGYSVRQRCFKVKTLQQALGISGKKIKIGHIVLSVQDDFDAVSLFLTWSNLENLLVVNYFKKWKIALIRPDWTYWGEWEAAWFKAKIEGFIYWEVGGTWDSLIWNAHATWHIQYLYPLKFNTLEEALALVTDLTESSRGRLHVSALTESGN